MCIKRAAGTGAARSRSVDSVRITPEEIARRKSSGDDFVFVDSRSPKAWGGASDKVPGSIRVPPDQVEQHLADLPTGKPIVAYCT